MKKSSNASTIHTTQLENQKNLYVSQRNRKRKSGEESILNTNQYEADEYRDNPQAFFTRLEHWSLDGG